MRLFFALAAFAVTSVSVFAQDTTPSSIYQQDVVNDTSPTTPILPQEPEQTAVPAIPVMPAQPVAATSPSATAVANTSTAGPVVAPPGHLLRIVPLPYNPYKDKKYATCKVFLRPDGRVFAAGGRLLRADGNCPPNFIEGKLLDNNQIHIARHDTRPETGERICILTPAGNCGGVRFLDLPNFSSATIVSSVMEQAAEEGMVKPESTGHILRVDKARGNIAVQPGDWSTCMVFRAPDGTNYVSRGKAIAASGKCPIASFQPGKLIGHDEIQIADRVCKLNKVGRCIITRMVSDSLPIVMPNDGSKW